MATIKATPTKELIKEYFNFGLLGTAASTTGLVVCSLGFDVQTTAAGTGAIIAAAWSIPAAALAWRSFFRLMDMTPRKRQAQPITVGVMASLADNQGGDGISYTANGKTTFLNSVPFLKNVTMPPAFDPTVRESDDITTRQIRYKPESKRLMYWDQDVIMRSDRDPIRVRLYEDLVVEIIGKAWRAQRGGRPHPLGADYLCHLHYSSRGNRRLRVEEHKAFIQLGNLYGIVQGNRQGHSGWLAGDWAWCFRQLGVSPISRPTAT